MKKMQYSTIIVLSVFYVLFVSAKQNENVEIIISPNYILDDTTKLSISVNDTISVEVTDQGSVEEAETLIGIWDIDSSDKTIVQEIDDQVFSSVERWPEYPGGEQALFNFIEENKQYPQSAIDMGIEGRVILRFVIDEEGMINNIQVVRGVHPDLDKEALRVAKLMSKWTPGEINGKKVKVYHTLPVAFRLRDVVK